MATLLTEIQKAKLREQLALLDAGEKALATELALVLPAVQSELTPEQRELFQIFAAWCDQKACRKCPAKPWALAAFIIDQEKLGVPAERILATIQAIEAAHDQHGLANPTATAVVRAAMDRILTVDPPRSWPKEDKAAFAMLPAGIREAISRRELQRDRDLRRRQNELAEEKKRLTNGADTKPVEHKEQELQNG
jgi:hypothetical protein